MTSSSNQNHQSATLNLPATDRYNQRQSIPCLFQAIEGKKLILESQEQPPTSAAVSIEYNDAMFLGEVVSSAPSLGGLWRAEIRVEQILTGLQSLMNLRASLLGEGAGARPARHFAGACA